jgi:molybdopterin-guanine dinucleotide biosynthesis protein MobB
VSDASPGRIPVLSVVGKSDSGKTTLLERLISELVRRGLAVGTLKHDAHDYDIDTPGKDSYRHRAAGAATSAVASGTKITMIASWDAEPSLFDLVDRYFDDVDLVLTEGYKSGPAPKIEVVRSARSTEPLCTPDELVLLVTDGELGMGVPTVGLDDVEGVADAVEAWLAIERAKRGP